MPNIITIFISADSKEVRTIESVIIPALRDELASLRGQGLIDFENIDFVGVGKYEINPKLLYAQLRKSNLFVAFVTPTYPTLSACTNELVRACESRVPVFLMVDTHRNEDHERYLDDFPEIEKTWISRFNDRGSSLDRAVEEFRKRLRTFVAQPAFRSEFAKADLRATMAEWLDAPLNAALQRSRLYSSLVDAVSRAALREIRAIIQEDYSLDLSTERDFLIRALVLFSHAKKVYAVSRDDISSFWTRSDSKNIESTVDYISKQAKDTVRLFVFSSPQAVQEHVDVLDASDRSYGRDGAVLVCTRAAYDAFMRESFSGARANDLRDHDFGLLYFGDDENRPLRAKLGNEYLSFHPLKSEETSEFAKFSARLEKLRFDTGAAGDRQWIRTKLTQDHQVLRWKEGLWREDRRGWSNTLRSMFGNLTSVCSHSVLFSLPDDKTVLEMERILLQLRREIIDALIEMGLQARVWIGRRLALTDARDALFHGRLITDRDIVPEKEKPLGGGRMKWEFLLNMIFDSPHDLKLWYSATRHAKLRRDVYELVSERARFLYKLADDVSSDAGSMRKVLWAEIEAEMVNHLWRLDFLEIEDFDDIADKAPRIRLPKPESTSLGDSAPGMALVP